MTDNASNHKCNCEGCALPKIIDDGIYNNYGEWKLISSLQLRCCDLWKYIDGPKSSPPDVPPLRETATVRGIDKASGSMTTIRVAGNEDEHQQKMKGFNLWMDGNDLALARIVIATPNAQLHLVMRMKSAKQAWESLRTYYERQNASKVTWIICDIKAFHCTPDMDVAQWLIDIQRLYASVCAVDSKGQFSDRNFALAVLDNMPLHEYRWRQFASALRKRVEEYDSHRPSPTTVRSHEFLAAIREEIWFRNRDDLRSRARAEKEARKRHLCPADAASNSIPTKRRCTSSNKICTNPHCGVPNGHNFADCVAYGGGSEGNYGPEWKGLWNIHLPAGQRTAANNLPPKWHPAYAKLTTASKPAF